MIDWEAAAKCICRKARCSMNEAWTAVSQLYIELDKNKSEEEQWAYLTYNGPLRVSEAKTRGRVLEHIEYTKLKDKACKFYSDSKEMQEPSEALAAPPDEQTDAEYLLEITKSLYPWQRICVLTVAKHLLDSNTVVRKPLSVEVTRKLLGKAKIPNSSEMARQVHTFLTTLKRKQ